MDETNPAPGNLHRSRSACGMFINHQAGYCHGAALCLRCLASDPFCRPGDVRGNRRDGTVTGTGIPGVARDDGRLRVDRDVRTRRVGQKTWSGETGLCGLDPFRPAGPSPVLLVAPVQTRSLRRGRPSSRLDGDFCCRNDMGRRCVRRHGISLAINNIGGPAALIALALSCIGGAGAARRVGVSILVDGCFVGFARRSSSRPLLCCHSVFGPSGTTRCRVHLGLGLSSRVHLTLSLCVRSAAGDPHVRPIALPPRF